MTEIYFQGFWRMDWGLGNPNKTAALIAILMVAGWGFAYWKRWGFWFSLVLFTALGICLIHTFSRGGIVAAFVGVLPLLAVLKRPLPWKRITAVVVATWVIVGASIYFQAHQRYGQGLGQEDRSISNRLKIWKAAPTMMGDAPGGWGLGTAGRAYMNWYQPLEDNETYRTLVNSHLTWLVELGWLGRFLYLAGWLCIFLICFPVKEAQWLAVPFGVWLAFFVSAAFSSVAESVWLWIVPGLALLWALAWRIWHRQWLTLKWWLLPPCAAALSLLLLFSVSDHSSPIHKVGGAVLIGSKTAPDLWVVHDKQVLGDKPGRQLRTAFSHSPLMSAGLVERISDLPAGDLGSLVLAGNIPEESRKSGFETIKTAKTVILVNPRFFPQELSLPDTMNLDVLVGEFSQSPAASSWGERASVRKLVGVGDFLPDWPSALFSDPK